MAYLQLVQHFAGLAIALYSVPLAIVIIGAVIASHRPNGSAWTTYVLAILVLSLIIWTAAAKYVGAPTPEVPAWLRIAATFIAAALLLALPAAVMQELPAKVSMGGRVGAAALVGCAGAVLAAPALLLSLGCILTGECL